MNADTLKIVATVVGAFVSAPLIFAFIKAGMFFGTMQQSVSSLQDALSAHVVNIERYIEQSNNRFEDHSNKINEHSGKIAVLWDGHERRRPQEAE